MSLIRLQLFLDKDCFLFSFFVSLFLKYNLPHGHLLTEKVLCWRKIFVPNWSQEC